MGNKTLYKPVFMKLEWSRTGCLFLLSIYLIDITFELHFKHKQYSLKWRMTNVFNLSKSCLPKFNDGLQLGEGLNNQLN